jgi:hypothetical protein
MSHFIKAVLSFFLSLTINNFHHARSATKTCSPVRLLLGGVVFGLVTLPSQAQWQWQNPLPQGNDLYSVMFVDPENGWSSSSAGTLLKTTDGGETWRVVALPIWIYAYDVFFIDRERGWTCGPAMGGSTSVILGTRDGGRNWETQCVYARVISERSHS